MRRALFALPLILVACGNDYVLQSRGASSAVPMVTILRDAGSETVLRGTVRANPDGSATFSVASSAGQSCEGVFGANGEGIFECDGRPAVTVAVPNEVYGQPSGLGVVAAGTARIGFGWGDDASVTKVRARF